MAARQSTPASRLVSLHIGVSAWANSSSQLVLAHQLSGPMPDLATSICLSRRASDPSPRPQTPVADVNCLKVPEGMPDDKVIFLSDIMPTGWHGAECGQVGEGDNVAIWGAGPVGEWEELLWEVDLIATVTKLVEAGWWEFCSHLVQNEVSLDVARLATLY